MADHAELIAAAEHELRVVGADASIRVPASDILAVLRAQPAVVKVRGLEWVEAKALGNSRKLIALDCFHNEFARLDLPKPSSFIENWKAQQQRRYDACILSALEPAALSKQEAVAWGDSGPVPGQHFGDEFNSLATQLMSTYPGDPTGEIAASSDAVAWQLGYDDGEWSMAVYSKGEAEGYLANAGSVVSIRPLYASPVPAEPSAEGWRSIEAAKKDGTAVLLNIGETIPGVVDARVATWISEVEAVGLGEPVSASGGWLIWNTSNDWFVLPLADAFGWMPLPASTDKGGEGNG